MGAVVALERKKDTAGFLRTFNSITLAFKHATALSFRLQISIIMLRRDASLCSSAITSSAKKYLMKLSVPRDGLLFEGKIAGTVSKYAETRN